MILVMLGTQDKPFNRLLEAIEQQIINGNIKEKVMVQAGYTKYQSEYMEIFDYISIPELKELIKMADLIITHGGVGSILDSLKYEKKIIAIARLKEYGEHVNNHQLEIIEEFAQAGYLLALNDLANLANCLETVKSFEPKKYVSNTNNMIKLIEDYIDTL